MIYDELEYAKKIHSEGFIGKRIKQELEILSKYFKHELNLSKKEHIKAMYEFCKNNIMDYNEVLHYKIIDSSIEKGRNGKNKLLIIKSIPIYKKDLENIDTYDVADDYKKIMLTLLINKKLSSTIGKIKNGNGKFSPYFNGNEKKYKEIFNSSRIGHTYEIHKVINELTKEGIIKPMNKGDIYLEYIKNIHIDEHNDEIFYNIKPNEFDKIGWVWHLYKQDNKVKLCENCGCLVKIHNNKMKYCGKCAKEIESENATIRKRNQRKKLNVTK